MYFCIYIKSSIGRIYLETLDYIDLTNSISLYDLKIKITKIEEKFEIYKLTKAKPDGEYVLLVTTYNPSDTERRS